MDPERLKRMERRGLSMHPGGELQDQRKEPHGISSVDASTAVKNSSLLQSTNCPYCYGSAAGYHIEEKTQKMVFQCQFCERSWTSE